MIPPLDILWFFAVALIYLFIHVSVGYYCIQRGWGDDISKLCGMLCGLMWLVFTFIRITP